MTCSSSFSSMQSNHSCCKLAETPNQCEVSQRQTTAHALQACITVTAADAARCSGHATGTSVLVKCIGKNRLYLLWSLALPAAAAAIRLSGVWRRSRRCRHPGALGVAVALPQAHHRQHCEVQQHDAAQCVGGHSKDAPAIGVVNA